MRLWHYQLLPQLPKQWLQGQHRECCALRGLGWGKPHATVDYVFNHHYEMLYQYHMEVMRYLELQHSVCCDVKWTFKTWRGRGIGYVDAKKLPNGDRRIFLNYPEHNPAYLEECLSNLDDKGVRLYCPAPTINQRKSHEDVRTEAALTAFC